MKEIIEQNINHISKLNLGLVLISMHAVFRNTLRTDWRQVLCAGRLNDFVCHQEQEVHQEKTVAS